MGVGSTSNPFVRDNSPSGDRKEDLMGNTDPKWGSGSDWEKAQADMWKEDEISS